jgi:hypothetical protein
LGYLGTRRGSHTVDVNVDNNIVHLRKITTSNTLDIKCREGDLFEVKISGRPPTTGDKSKMIRGVIEWLNEFRSAEPPATFPSAVRTSPRRS